MIKLQTKGDVQELKNTIIVARFNANMGTSLRTVAQTEAFTDLLKRKISEGTAKPDFDLIENEVILDELYKATHPQSTGDEVI